MSEILYPTKFVIEPMFFLYVTTDPGYPSRVTGNIDIIQHIDIVSENSILNILTLRQNMTF